jgi:aspartokinase/homoserine dehydrogenase 1
MGKLPSLDPLYARERDAASREGKVLRYIASFSGGKAGVSLERVGPESPCYALSGSDIIIALTTANCRNQPIVIKGPGAGADVTATGVLADIIRISYHEG